MGPEFQIEECPDLFSVPTIRMDKIRIKGQVSREKRLGWKHREFRTGSRKVKNSEIQKIDAGFMSYNVIQGPSCIGLTITVRSKAEVNVSGYPGFSQIVQYFRCLPEIDIFFHVVQDVLASRFKAKLKHDTTRSF